MPAIPRLQNPRHTINACYLAIIGQAVVNNFVPLLLLTFERQFGLTLSDIATLVGFNFLVQLATDLVAAFVVDRIGYKPSMVFGQAASFLGMAGLAVFPFLMPPFLGLMLAVFIYAVGGGLAEVLVSPIVEMSPSEHKASAMSLLHSFYCWGHVFVVLASSAFFLLFGLHNWRILAVLWSLLPLLNSLYFQMAPMPRPAHSQQLRGALRIFRQPVFYLMILLMVCSGASEQSVSQWASAFAESGAGVSKALGDLAGPTFFALLMGLSRVLHARIGRHHSLEKLMLYSSLLCVGAYLLIILGKSPLLTLLGVGLTGFSVGIFWPGTLSMSALRIPMGGTAMYALLALAGDLGCSLGPSVVGYVSDASGGQLGTGFLAAMAFPLLLSLLLLPTLKRRKGDAT